MTGVQRPCLPTRCRGEATSDKEEATNEEAAMLTFLNRAWVPLVVVVAVALGAVAVDRLRGVFGSDAIFTATGSSAEPLEPSHVKQVTYEVYGPGDATGSVSYLDQNTQPAEANFTGLPWTLTITTTPTWWHKAIAIRSGAASRSTVWSRTSNPRPDTKPKRPVWSRPHEHRERG